MASLIDRINEILVPEGVDRAGELRRSELVEYLRENYDYNSKDTTQCYRDFGDSRVALVYWKRTRSVEAHWILFDKNLNASGEIWEYSLSFPNGRKRESL